MKEKWMLIDTWLETIEYKGKAIYEEYPIRDILVKSLKISYREIHFEFFKRNKTYDMEIIITDKVNLSLMSKKLDKAYKEIFELTSWVFSHISFEPRSLDLEKGNWNTYALVLYFTKSDKEKR